MDRKLKLSLIVVIVMLPGMTRQAAAHEVPSVTQLEGQFETQLNTRTEPYGQPKAISYYDDLVEHDEQVQWMREEIAEGLN